MATRDNTVEHPPYGLSGGRWVAPDQPRLTHEDVKVLRQPFAAVKYMPVGQVFGKEGAHSGQFLAYLDSSLVAERLSEVDPGWTAEYERLGSDFNDWKAAGYPTVCRVTVKGVTREDIGKAGGGIEPVKAAYSDALKRAAWRHGVGAYLRDSGWDFWINEFETDQNGKRHCMFTVKPGQKAGTEVVKALKPAGRVLLRSRYEAIVQGSAFVEHYGAVRTYGDVEEALEDVEHDTEVGAEDDAPMSLVGVELLLDLAKYNGRQYREAQLRDAFERRPLAEFEAEWKRQLVPVSGHLGLNSNDRDTLVALALRAVNTEDPVHIEELRTYLEDADEASRNQPLPDEAPEL